MLSFSLMLIIAIWSGPPHTPLILNLFTCYRKLKPAWSSFLILIPTLNLSSLSLISFFFMLRFLRLIFVFSQLNGLLPTPVSSLLHLNSDYHNYMTRSRHNLHKFHQKYQFALTFQAPNIWNDILLMVRNSLTKHYFRYKSKLYFLNMLLRAVKV